MPGKSRFCRDCNIKMYHISSLMYLCGKCGTQWYISDRGRKSVAERVTEDNRTALEKRAELGRKNRRKNCLTGPLDACTIASKGGPNERPRTTPHDVKKR